MHHALYMAPPSGGGFLRRLPVRRVMPGRVSVFRRIQMRREREGGLYTMDTHASCQSHAAFVATSGAIGSAKRRAGSGAGETTGASHTRPRGGTGSHPHRVAPHRARALAAGAAARSRKQGLPSTRRASKTRDAGAGALNCLRERARERERERARLVKTRGRKAIVRSSASRGRKPDAGGSRERTSRLGTQPVSLWSRTPRPRTTAHRSASARDGQTEQTHTVRTCTRDEDGAGWPERELAGLAAPKVGNNPTTRGEDGALGPHKAEATRGRERMFG